MYCRGKGCKDRCIPLTADTRQALTNWLAERQATGTDPLTLLRAGVDITVIAFWLSHESPTTTRVYLQADMALNHAPGTTPVSIHPHDPINSRNPHRYERWDPGPRTALPW